MVTWGTNQVFTYGNSSNSSNNSNNNNSGGAGAVAVAGAGAVPAGGIPPPPPPPGGLFATTTTMGAPAPATTMTNPPPTAPLFGASIASGSGGGGGGLFGQPATTAGAVAGAVPPTTTTGLFGGGATSTTTTNTTTTMTAPAPPNAPLFGSAPSTGSLFGPTPAPTTTTTTTTPTATATAMNNNNAFGTSMLFGQAQQQQQQQQAQQQQMTAIPAQAAWQGYMDASARQETAKFQSNMERFHSAYVGTSTTGDSFVTIVYNPMTPEQLQQKFAASQIAAPQTRTNSDVSINTMTPRGAVGGLFVPPCPPQVSQDQWLEAVVRNPDPDQYIPTALIGAEALQARLGWQHDRSHQQLAKGLAQLQMAHVQLRNRSQGLRQKLRSTQHRYAHLRQRLLESMKKVELLRCTNVATQTDEVKLSHRLTELLKHVDEINTELSSMSASSAATTTSLPSNAGGGNGGAIATNHDAAATNRIMITDPSHRQALLSILQEHRQSLVQLSTVVQKDRRDVRLLNERVNLVAASAGAGGTSLANSATAMAITTTTTTMTAMVPRY